MIDLNTDVHSQDENTKRITRKKTGKFRANRTQMCGKRCEDNAVLWNQPVPSGFSGVGHN